MNKVQIDDKDSGIDRTKMETVEITTGDSKGHRTLKIVPTIVGPIELDTLGQPRLGKNQFANL